jgi:hypothetical protein
VDPARAAYRIEALHLDSVGSVDCVRYQRYQCSHVADDDDTRPFTIPLPPGFPPPLPPGDRVLYLRSDDGEARDHDDLMVRKVPRESAMQFRAAAGGRGMTHAQYLAALLALHARVRELADAGDERLAADLEGLGLQTVSV